MKNPSHAVQTLRLARGQSIATCARRGTRITVCSGCAWLTVERDARDFVLTAGRGRYRLLRHCGGAVILGCGDGDDRERFPARLPPPVHRFRRARYALCRGAGRLDQRGTAKPHRQGTGTAARAMRQSTRDTPRGLTRTRRAAPLKQARRPTHAVRPQAACREGISIAVTQSIRMQQRSE